MDRAGFEGMVLKWVLGQAGPAWEGRSRGNRMGRGMMEGEAAWKQTIKKPDANASGFSMLVELRGIEPLTS